MVKKLISVMTFLALLPTNSVYAQRKSRLPDPAKYNLDSSDEKLKKIAIRLEVVSDYSAIVKGTLLKYLKTRIFFCAVVARVSDERSIALDYVNNGDFLRYKPLLLGSNDFAIPYPASTQERSKRRGICRRNRSGEKRFSGKAVARAGL